MELVIPMIQEISNQKINLIPFDTIEGFEVRPGFYEINGATAIPGGVNFTIHSNQATSCELLLFHRTEEKPYAILKFPKQYRIGNVYSMIVFQLNIEDFEYAYRLDGPYIEEKGIIYDKTKYLLDPYAKAVTGQSIWGEKMAKGYQYKARVVKDNFDWGNFVQPLIPMEDVIIYEMHVRGFTRDLSSEVAHPGTFAGLKEKIPYLKELGITAVELMPIFEFDELLDKREYNGNKLLDYWGYNTVSFFAPNTGYCSTVEYNREGNELKELIKELHENKIEVYLDVVFNHTAEGNEKGPFFSFKGIDNNIYYLLTPEGNYYNFSGCGNTLNCNHPIVQQMILECLRYWVTAYRIDGFRFDLASILGRNEDGSPMSKPPLLQSLAFDPILGNVKLIAEAWDAGGLYQVGCFPAWNRWVEWNGKYRDDIRSFLKGDYGKIEEAANRITGSRDLYHPENKENSFCINFITCHDGFTLHDLYSYNEKHNENNGWNNTDGSNDNYSWNCGVEGETSEKEVKQLRERMVKNACAVLLCSRGIPMFLAGDEFGNSQFGNNNAYCQDNTVSWLDWRLLYQNHELYEFFRTMIQFRKDHRVIRTNTSKCSLHLPEVSIHGLLPFQPNYETNNHYLGILYAGRNQENSTDDIIYVAINTYWEAQEIELPQLSVGVVWKQSINTNNPTEEGMVPLNNKLIIAPRTVVILQASSL